MPEMTSRWTFSPLLLLAAAIWGFAFVAQRVGMEHVGPFTFNAVRFALGGIVLLPLVALRKRQATVFDRKQPAVGGGMIWRGGVIAGLALFAGASFQQTGIVHTTAGKAGFITGLYVIIVPIMGLLWKQRMGMQTWLGAILAAIGLYFLSAPSRLSIASGDLLVLASAFMWAGHVHIIAWLSPRIDPIQLACRQFLICSAISFVVAGFTESVSSGGLKEAAVPILYAGLMSTGVAYTLQVVAQRRVHPAHAAIILSLEAVFAAIGGWLMLGEVLSIGELFGALLMLAGMLLSQINLRIRRHHLATDEVPAGNL
jgi:drug/metabolite transporter (DMT)-like permease